MGSESEEITIEMMRESFYSAVVSDALDGKGYRNQCIGGPLPPYTGVNKLVGRCKTSLWEEIDFEDPEPYALELKAVDACRPDEVLVAAAGGSMRSGIWGELLTTASRNTGCVGAIIDGAVRDITPIKAMDFPVFARGVSPYDSLHRQRVMSVDEPVEIGCVTIASGDLVVADEDGIVIVPQKVEEEVVQAAWNKVHAENEVRDAIRNGMSATEAFETYGVL